MSSKDIARRRGFMRALLLSGLVIACSAGGATVALWSATAIQPTAPVVNGGLQLTFDGWYPANPSSFTVNPGDGVGDALYKVTATLDGDNIAATLRVDVDGTFTAPAGFSFVGYQAYDVNADGTMGAPLSTFTGAGDAATIDSLTRAGTHQFIVRARFDWDADSYEYVSDVLTGVASPSASVAVPLTARLEQLRAGEGFQ